MMLSGAVSSQEHESSQPSKQTAVVRSPGQFKYNLIMAPKSIHVRWPDTRIPRNNELAEAAGAAVPLHSPL